MDLFFKLIGEINNLYFSIFNVYAVNKISNCLHHILYEYTLEYLELVLIHLFSHFILKHSLTIQKIKNVSTIKTKIFKK